MELPDEILEKLSHKELLTSADLPDLPFNTIKSALDTLGSRELIHYQQIDKEEALLTEEGLHIANEGSHEAKIYNAVKAATGGLKIQDLPKGKDAAFGQGAALKRKWIKKDGDRFKANTDSIHDVVQEQLQMVQETRTVSDPDTLKDLKKRKLVTTQKVLSFKVSKGPKYSNTFVREKTDLTAEMLATGEWKTVKLKPYNFKAKGALTPTGALHPLNKVRHEFRQIFFEMGFTEMPTNRYVETGFWNFDALFIPQQHPARDQQDTFFVSEPPSGDPPRQSPEDDTAVGKPAYEQYFKNIKAVHQEGGYGSIGYRYPWSAEESLKLVLRTHTTAISTDMLHRLALDPRPARYFSIDRVFRNETVDATHLAEFHQIEGVIADYGLSLGGLIGFMQVFFKKMGIENLRFKPAYNPYTEPSMEIFGYHEGLGKWVEIGNSGMFRPEMLEPMGLPKDMRVYGWGLSLERPTMIKYGVSNIRELLGHKVDLNFIETNPAVRLDKD